MLIPFLTGLLLIVSYALWRGGAPERADALVFVLMAVFQFSGRLFFDRVFSTVDLLGFATDLLALAGFTLIALQANRIWPLFIAAMQLLSCVSHFGREVSDKVEPLVYAVLMAGPTAVGQVILLAGTLAHRRRIKRGIRMESWTPGTVLPAWMPGFLTR
jgi:hypothetical protein